MVLLYHGHVLSLCDAFEDETNHLLLLHIWDAEWTDAMARSTDFAVLRYVLRIIYSSVICQ